MWNLVVYRSHQVKSSFCSPVMLNESKDMAAFQDVAQAQKTH